MAYEQEFEILERVRELKPQMSQLTKPTWNEAVSLQAKLVRAIKEATRIHYSLPVTNPSYGQNPYAGLAIHILKPGVLRFVWDPPIRAYPVGTPPEQMEVTLVPVVSNPMTPKDPKDIQ